MVQCPRALPAGWLQENLPWKVLLTQNASFPPIQLDLEWSWLRCLSAGHAVPHAEPAVAAEPAVTADLHAEAAVHPAEPAVLAAACQFEAAGPSWRRKKQSGQQAALERRL